VVRFQLKGATGIELLLSTNLELRSRALHSVASRCDGRMAMDGFWVDVQGEEVAPFRVDDEATARCDIA